MKEKKVVREERNKEKLTSGDLGDGRILFHSFIEEQSYACCY